MVYVNHDTRLHYFDESVATAHYIDGTVTRFSYSDDIVVASYHF